jgi:hypothetical protein
MVLGPAGTLFVFDANRIKHRARPPVTRAREALDFVIGPRLPGAPRRVLWCGMNNWPVDPFTFSLDGALGYPDWEVA